MTQKTIETAQNLGSKIATQASTAVNASKHVVEEAINKGQKMATEAQDKIKSKLNPTSPADTKDKNNTTKSKEAAATETIPEVFSKCSGCHGKDGKMKALGKSEIIAGQPKDELISKIKEYKAGTRNVAGMGALMKGQVSQLSDADIESIASYLSGLK